MLASEDDVEIAAECRNGREVIEALKTSPVDFLLLDIQMHGMSGVDIVRSIGASKMPATVFVTAYSDYAVKAFELHALDYLVKPIESKRLHEAVERVRERVRSRESFIIQEEQLSSVLKVLQTAATALNTYPQRLLAKNGNKDCVVAVADIEWIQAADYYVCLHAKGKEHLVRGSIKVLDAKLDPAKFVRLHRSAIVNVDYVREIHRDGRTGWVLLSSGARVRMNKAGWQKLVAISGC